MTPDYWIGDYTIEPENGGVGVFAHEFGHDLGLPDLYDTSGNTGGAENSVGFWSLVLQRVVRKHRSRRRRHWIKADSDERLREDLPRLVQLHHGRVRGKGVAQARPGVANTKQAQAIVALLPDKEVDFPVGDPYAGDFFYFSGSGNDLDNSMTRSVTLPAGAPSLTAKVKYDIETRLGLRLPDGQRAPVATNLSSDTNPNGQNFGNGITGNSGGAWVDLTADLSAYRGPDRHDRFPLLDRCRRGESGILRGRHRDQRSASGRCRDRPWLGLYRIHPHRIGSVRSRSSTPTSPSSATIAATTTA